MTRGSHLPKVRPPRDRELCPDVCVDSTREPQPGCRWQTGTGQGPGAEGGPGTGVQALAFGLPRAAPVGRPLLGAALGWTGARAQGSPSWL